MIKLSKIRETITPKAVKGLNTDLAFRNGPARVIRSDPPHNFLNPGTVTPTPHEVKAGHLSVVLVLAGWNRRRHERLRVVIVSEGRGGGVARVGGFLDEENESDEEER